MTNKLVVSARVTAEVLRAIDAAALAERRPRAHWMELALEKVLTEKGLLKGTSPLARAPLPDRNRT